jgi:hypothetical protein
MAVKMSKMTSAVDDQQPFERLAWSKHFGDLFQLMEEELEISRETVRRILVQDIGKRKMNAWFVPRCLTDEQEAVRLQAYQ